MPRRRQIRYAGAMMTRTAPRLLLTALLSLTVSPAPAEEGKPIRIGVVGLDTSHAKAFTDLINDPESAVHVPGVAVVAAVKQSSADIPSSVERVEGYTEHLVKNRGVKLYDTIEAMCQNVDAVMIESVDGRPHLAQATPALLAGKPTYIDKPISASLKDTLAIFALAKKHHTQVWSSSNLRFHAGVIAARDDKTIGEQTLVFSFGPSPTEEHHPDLAWYGIHPVETLFTVLGNGCESVARISTDKGDLASGTWSGGRIGMVHGIRGGKVVYGVKVFGTKGVAEYPAGGAYPEIVTEIIKFFQTGVAPVPPETTTEIMAFMEAADESKRLGGAPVSIQEWIKKNTPAE